MKAENVEFIALWKATNWSQAETARRLDLSRSAVGKFIKGVVTPSAQTLKYFKMILVTDMPGALTGASAALNEGEMAMSDWEKKLFAELRGLHAHDRERVLNAIKAFVAGLPKRPPVDYLSSGRSHISNIAPEKIPLPDWVEAADAAHRAAVQKPLSPAPAVPPAADRGRASGRKK